MMIKIGRLDIQERDLSDDEFTRMQDGFAEHQLENGVPAEPNDRFTFIAMDGDRMVGCSSGVRQSNWVYLSDLWVEKDWRGRGLGTLLLEKLEKRIQSCGVKRIFGWTNSFEAPGFYQKRGYTIFCELEHFFSTGQSRLGFKKVLAE